MQSTQLFYRKSAAQGASGLGLLIALYDTLAGDLLRAVDAERSNNLEQRCLEVNHAVLVIGYLEDTLERGNEGELTQQMRNFYSSLRQKLIEAQAKRSAKILEEQVQEILRIRESCQKVELSSLAPTVAVDKEATLGEPDTLAYQPSPSTSWSA